MCFFIYRYLYTSVRLGPYLFLYACLYIRIVHLHNVQVILFLWSYLPYSRLNYMYFLFFDSSVPLSLTPSLSLSQPLFFFACVFLHLLSQRGGRFIVCGIWEGLQQRHYRLRSSPGRGSRHRRRKPVLSILLLFFLLLLTIWSSSSLLLQPPR